MSNGSPLLNRRRHAFQTLFLYPSVKCPSSTISATACMVSFWEMMSEITCHSYRDVSGAGMSASAGIVFCFLICGFCGTPPATAGQFLYILFYRYRYKVYPYRVYYYEALFWGWVPAPLRG